MTKRFDAVAMKRRGAEAIRKATAHMTFDEELAYWQERSQRLEQRILEARQRLADGDEQHDRSSFRRILDLSQGNDPPREGDEIPEGWTR